MPSPNLINRFATQLLQPDHIHIAVELVDSHIDKEMKSPVPDKAKLSELFALKSSVEKAKDVSQSE